jgi:hypothetical protein
MSIFGGNWTNENKGLNSETGWCTVPHASKIAGEGSQVFVFFESGNINKPVYFASAQSGAGWFSEHPNQHVFKSDNVRIRIDEQPSHPDSTCKFNSYNQKNNVFSIEDGTKKDVQTRIDIEVLAKDLNAVNLQIKGDVNMKIDGDWYLEHTGNKHETHIGNTYIKHVGNTIIEEEGDIIYSQDGSYNRKISQDVNLEIGNDYIGTIAGDFSESVWGNTNIDYLGNYTEYIGEDCTTEIAGSRALDIIKSSNVFIGEDSTISVGGDLTQTGNKSFINTFNNDISFTAVSGNIDLKTEGKAEKLDVLGNITQTGYNNIGTTGNIRIVSTFGNIALNTIEDISVADFNKEYTCVPWNPGYLQYMSVLSKIPGFDLKSVCYDLSNLCSDLVTFLKNLPNALILYDGFPTFLPCKMILQNPNVTPPSDSSWIKTFGDADDDWNAISNTKFWKVPGKVMGNIDISSWSGDINIKTQGKLGNAGNINIHANNNHGVLPAYNAGQVNISANSPLRVYTDPRHLFFDSNLKAKIGGNFVMFSTPNSTPGEIPVASIKPFEQFQTALNLIGLPFSFGFKSADSGGINNGCISCICDVLDATVLRLGGYSLVPWEMLKPLLNHREYTHTFNSVNGSLVEPMDCAVSVLTDKFSNGFGHAVDTYDFGQAYETAPLGSINFNSVGSQNINAGKNYTVKSYDNGWDFGIERSVTTDWIAPKMSVFPPDPGIMLPKGTIPFLLKDTTKYNNKSSQYDMGSIEQNNYGITDTGIYSLGGVGSFTVNLGNMKTSVPYGKLDLAEVLIGNGITELPQKMFLDLSGQVSTSNIPSVFNAAKSETPVFGNGETKADSEEVSLLDKIAAKLSAPSAGFRLELGNITGWVGLLTSGRVEFEKLKDQLPNTCKVLETSEPVQQVVAPMVGVPPTPQGVKFIPNIPQIKFADIYEKAKLIIDVNDISGGFTQKAFIPGATLLSGSLFPNDKDIPPVLSSMTRIVVPDLAGEIDNQLSVGTALQLLDPIGFLTKKAMEGASFLKTAEFNQSLGTNFPTFLAEPLGLRDIGRISGGLLPDMTIGIGGDLVNEGELLSGQALLKLPVGLADVINDSRPKIEADFTFVRNSIRAVVSPFEFELAAGLIETKKAKHPRGRMPIFSIYSGGSFMPLEAEAEIKVLDALPDIATQLTLGFRNNAPSGKLKILGFEIIKLPQILGSGLIKGIKKIFGL